MKKISFFLLFALMAIAASAQQRDIAEASMKARQFLDRVKPVSKATVTDRLTLAYSASTDKGAAFHVFNRNLNDGFVIVSGGDNQSVIGYCENGTFDYDRLPDNMRWWLSQYTDRYVMSVDGVQDVAAEVSRPMRSAQRLGRESIELPLTTKWDQGTPYCNAIPKLPTSSLSFLTGCVATAVAQVMKYHATPATHGTGSHSYTLTYNKTTPMTFTADFENTTYDWDNMLDVYKGVKYTDAQANAVATLMYHVGVGLEMKYNTLSSGGSGSSSARIPALLYNYFGYDKSVYMATRSFYNDEDWEDLIYNELKNGRPVLYGGKAHNGDSAHEFVCYGYDADTDLYAFNWGWSGYCDGYFAITGEPGTGVLRPKPGSGGGSAETSEYCDDQTAIINVMPDCGRDYHIQLMTYADCIFYDATGSRATVANIKSTNPQLKFYVSVRNMSVTGAAPIVGMAFRNVETGEMVYADETMALNTIDPNMLMAYILKFKPTNITRNGEYEVVPVYKLNETDEWEKVLWPLTKERPRLIVTERQTTTAIQSAETTGLTAPSAIFDINGRRHKNLEKGINIVKTADGTVKRIMK